MLISMSNGWIRPKARMWTLRWRRWTIAFALKWWEFGYTPACVFSLSGAKLPYPLPARLDLGPFHFYEGRE